MVERNFDVFRLGSGLINPLEAIRAACFKFPKLWGGITSNLYSLSEAQIARIRLYFPKSHGMPRVDDEWYYLR